MTRQEQITKIKNFLQGLGTLDTIQAENGPVEEWEQRELDNAIDDLGLETEEEGE